MGLGLAGIGSFAGGMATGIQQGQRMHHDMERQKREREEDERQKGMRLAGSNTFGNVGTDREDGSIYGEGDAAQDYLKQSAPYDNNPLQTRAAAQGLSRGRRQEGYEEAEDKWFKFQQQHHMLPDQDYFRAAAKFATQSIPDGKSFGVTFDANAGFQATMVDPEGNATSRPIQSRQQFDSMLQRYLSPNMMKHADTMGLKGREVDQKDREIALKERDIASQEGLRGSMGRAYDALAGQREQTSANKMPEADRVYFTRLGQNEQAAMLEMSKLDPMDPNAAQARKGINSRLLRIKKEQYDVLRRNNALPASMTKTAFLGLEDPLAVARFNMATFAGDEQKFRASMDAFDEMYGDAPEASEARNALAVFMQQQFYSRVPTQNTLLGGGEVNFSALKAGQAVRGGLGGVADFAQQYHPYIRGSQLVPGLIRDNAPSFIRGLTRPDDAKSR